MSDVQNCAVCGEAAGKGSHPCGICARHVCKNCLEYVDTNAFSFFSRCPPELLLANYCPTCFDEKVLPQRVRYDELMEKAKDVYFITKAYPGYVRVLRRHTKRVIVEKCDDRRETIVRMAFFAAELGFNSIIEAEVDSTKVRMGGRQSSLWHGSSMPANIDGEQLERSSLRRI